jgi:hypothetical protein
VLVDTATGKTWVLHRGGDGSAAWLPARRIDSDKEARQWREADKARGAAAADEQRAKDDVLRQAQAERDAVLREAQRLRDAQQQQREDALRALEEAQRRLRDLEQKQPPPK